MFIICMFCIWLPLNNLCSSLANHLKFMHKVRYLKRWTNSNLMINIWTDLIQMINIWTDLIKLRSLHLLPSCSLLTCGRSNTTEVLHQRSKSLIQLKSWSHIFTVNCHFVYFIDVNCLPLKAFDQIFHRLHLFTSQWRYGITISIGLAILTSDVTLQ
jgi:hypothetical protein